ncbi:general secretion pathway protein G [Oxalobacteraceae bacterium GrIS 2.11]
MTYRIGIGEMHRNAKNAAGFTMVELLVVLAIIALLLTIAAPRFLGGISTAKDDVLHENLYLMRQSIDHFYSDKGKYPASLDDLVTQHYLRQIPMDPVVGNNTSWIIVPPTNSTKGSVFDIKSSAPGSGVDGTSYQSW